MPRLLISIALLLLLCLAAKAQAKVTTFAYNTGVTPLKFEDSHGQASGILIDIWKLWATKTGRDIAFQVTSTFNESVELVTTGQADVNVGMFSTPERTAFLEFSDPIFTLNYHIFTHPSVRAAATLEELHGLVVGVTQEGFSRDLVGTIIPEHLIRSYKSNDALIRAALNGEIRAFVSTEVAVLYYLKENLLVNIFGYFQDQPLARQTYHAAVRKGRHDLIAEINAGLARISESDLQALLRPWIATPRKPIPPDFAASLTPAELEYLGRKGMILVQNESDWAPFNFNEDGTPRGYSIDYISLLADKIGLSVRFLSGGTWDEYQDMLKDGMLDVMMNIVVTPEREHDMAFTPPYVDMLQMLYTRRGSPWIGSLEDLSGMRFAVPKGFFFQEILNDSPEIEIVKVRDTTEAVLAVSSGRADVLLDMAPVVNSIMHQRRITNLEIGGRVPALMTGVPIPMHIAVNRRESILADILAKGMALISPAELAELKQIWLDRPGSGKESVAAQPLRLTSEEQAWLDEQHVVRVAGIPDWPPFEFRSPLGAYEGITADVFSLAAARAGILFRVEIAPWNDLLDKLRNRELDLAPGMGRTPERERFLLFTPPFYETRDAIFIRHESPPVARLDDLAGHTVVLEAGYYWNDILRRDYPEIVIINETSTLDSLRAVVTGKADAYIGTEGVASFLMAQEIITTLRPVAYLERQVDLSIGIRDDWPLLHSILSKALDTITDQEIRDIQRRYLTVETEAPDSFTLTPEEEAWLEAHPVIRLGISPDWPPFEFFDHLGNPAGISSDYMAIIAEKLGVRTDPLRGLTWNELLREAEAGRVDVLPCIAPSEERAAYLNFTRPYLHAPMVIVTRDDAPIIVGLEDFENQTIAVIRGYITQTLLERDHPKLNLLLVDNLEQALTAVSTGQAMAAVDTIPAMEFVMRQQGLKNLKVAATTEYAFNLAMGVRKDWPELVAILDRALESFTDIERSIIYGKWVNMPVAKPIDWGRIWRWAMILGMLAAIILTAFLYWSWRLATEAANRKAAEMKLRAMSDASHDAVIMINGQGTVLFWNKAAETMFGIPADQALHAMMHHLFVPEKYREAAEKGLMEFARTGQGPVIGAVVEHEAVRRDGTRFPVEIAVSSFQMESKWYAVGTVRDITSRKEAEKAIFESQRKMRTLIDNIPAVVLMKDLHGRYLMVNAVFKQSVGLDYLEIVGKTDFDIFPAEVAQGIVTMDRKTLDGGEHLQFEEDVPHQDGSMRTYETVHAPLTRDDGEIYGMVSISTDITERKMTEDALRKSELQHRIMFEKSPLGMILFDHKGIILDCNDKFAEIMGSTREQLVGSNTAGKGSPELHKVVQQGLSGAITTFEGEHALRINGATAFLKIFFNPIEPDNRHTKVIATVEDITERKQFQNKLRENLKELERFSRLVVGREERMIELKTEINELQTRQGLDARYVIVE